MDIIDRANDLAEDERARNIAAAIAAKPIAEATGRCLNCATKVRPGRRWCDPECREDWEARECRKR
jgi:hypothetical protein